MNRLVSSVILVLAVIWVLYSTIFVVDQRQYAIVFALGKAEQVIDKPGLHFKLPRPFQDVLFLDKRLLTIESPTETDRFITAEKKNILVDTFVKWRIVDPIHYYENFGGEERRA
jgi:modulator of FtsH protease HflC